MIFYLIVAFTSVLENFRNGEPDIEYRFIQENVPNIFPHSFNQQTWIISERIYEVLIRPIEISLASPNPVARNFCDWLIITFKYKCSLQGYIIQRMMRYVTCDAQISLDHYNWKVSCLLNILPSLSWTLCRYGVVQTQSTQHSFLSC